MERHIPDILRRIGAGKVEDFKILPLRLRDAFMQLDKGISCLEASQVMAYLCSMKGERWAQEYIAERTEGKVPNMIKLAFNPEEVQMQLNTLGLGIISEPEQGNIAGENVDPTSADDDN